MADTKITALTAITTVNPAVYPLPIVDTSDTSMAASGTTKKVTVNQILGSGGTATLASATITGDLTVKTNVLKVDTTNNRVGIGTASPGSSLEVAGSIRATGSNGSATASIGVFDYVAGTTTRLVSYGSNTTTAGAFQFTGLSSNASAGDIRYAIDATGIHTWSNVGGVAGTAMTLNSTGLGVGVSPNRNLDIRQDQSAATIARIQNQSVNAAAYAQLSLTASGNNWGILVGSSAANSNRLEFVVDPSGTNLSVMRLDTSGNVGVGVTPSGKLEVQESGTGGGFGGIIASTATAGGNAGYVFRTGGTNRWSINLLGSAGAESLRFYDINNSAARMTLDASGNLLVGTTTTSGNAGGLKLSNVGGTLGQITFSNNSGVADYVARFNYGSTPTLVGTITVASGGTTYNTTSDYRLKESVQPLVGGLARVSALKPSIYKWKSDGSSGEGFLAHELAEVVPFAVTGEKDAVNEDGSVKAQGVDLSRVVPILVAAIQELTARVQTLETR